VGIKAYLSPQAESEDEAFRRIADAMGETRGLYPSRAAPIRPYKRIE